MNKLLIVEDELLIAESLKSMDEWEERNIEVVGIATNGSEAIKWIENEHLDIILSDIQMPDKNGLELLQYINERKKEIQTIIISGYEQFSYAQTAIKYNAKGYVLKPIDTDELFEIVDSIIPKSQDDLSSVQNKTYHEAIINQVKSFIYDNIEKSITLKDAAKEAHLSPHYLGQIFKSVTGENFVPYVTKLKMERACELLKNPINKVYDISNKLGYNDPQYFTKVFIKAYGVSPKRYREATPNNENINMS